MSLQWPWCRLVAAVAISPPAWELTYATDEVPLKKSVLGVCLFVLILWGFFFFFAIHPDTLPSAFQIV